MKTLERVRRWGIVGGALSFVAFGAVMIAAVTVPDARAGLFDRWGHHPSANTGCVTEEGPPQYELGGHWYWLRSPDEEKRIISGMFNRYCIRCHGVDGRGVWDIPDVPNFTNTQWQASRSDGQIARIILEGRGGVMPPFRGTLTLEEAWAMARYLRTFVPGTEASRPDLGSDKRSKK